MLNMDYNPSGNTLTSLVGTVDGRAFKHIGTGIVFFCVHGLTGGQIDIEFQAYKDGPWTALDSTNLSFTADGHAYAVCGNGKIRAASTSATTSTTLFVGISGSYVIDPMVSRAA